MRAEILLILLLLVHPASYSQNNSPVKKARRTVWAQKTDFREVALLIRSERPKISNSVLVCDQKVIANVLPHVREQFIVKGFTEKDSIEAVLDGWKIVRLTSELQTDRCMNTDSFKNLMVGLGKLIFTTTPEQATIHLDGRDLQELTTYERWFEPKTYQVRYSKVGYDDVAISCTAIKGEPRECHADLPKKN